MKVLTVVGARPQFIKAAALSRSLRNPGGSGGRRITERIVHTGQHYDDNMSRQFFEELEIPEPDVNLGVGSGLQGAQTGRILERLEGVLLEERPDICIVYGDTNSTLAGALAAVKLHIPVAHVEAGLRSFNRRMPEEINRLLTDDVSGLLFCPTDTAVENLRREGIVDGVHQVGDIMYDCALYYGEMAESREGRWLDGLGVQRGGYLAATVHRAENTDDPERLRRIVRALSEAAAEACPVIIPLHPRTRKCLEQGAIRFGEHVHVLEPVSYMRMALLQKNARIVLTDSGGMQKEAYFFKVPCITLRDETEWVETVDARVNVLCGADEERIREAIDAMGSHSHDFERDLFGKGDTAARIAGILSRFVQ